MSGITLYSPVHSMYEDEGGSYVKLEELERVNNEVARLTLLLQMRTAELEAARVKRVIAELDREDAVGVNALQYVYQYRSKAPNVSSFPDWLTCNKPVYDRFKNYNYDDGWQYQTRRLIILGE